MKKKAIIVCVGLAAAALLVFAVLISHVVGKEITPGRYCIENNQNYPDAYIEVKDNKIQLYNIDLNALFRDNEMEQFRRLVEINPDYAMPEDELEIISDLNAMFTASPFDSSNAVAIKTGTFEYTYYCNRKSLPFGLVLQYDSFHKTLIILNDPEPILFKRQ